MKILHVIASIAPRYGGPSKACFEMARAVARMGHTASIYTTNQDGSAELHVPTHEPVFREGVEIRYFPIQRPRSWSVSIPLALALRRAIPEYDLVHLHSLYLFHGAAAGHYCRKYGVPYLIRPHSTLDPFIYRRHRLRKSLAELLFEHRNIKHAAAIHFTTEEERRLAEPYTFQTPGIVVPLGLELSAYENLPEPDSFRSRHPETRGKRIILFYGRINFKKGLDILVRAFGSVARLRDDAHLVIAGPDNEGWARRVRGWLLDEGVCDRATFTGMLQGTDALALMRDAEMLVLPSHSENFGISVIEAMACGLPVIISDRVNIFREVEASLGGRVAPLRPDAFAHAMVDLLDHPEMARQMGQCGRAFVRAHYDWSTVAVALQDAYRSVVSGSLRDGRPREAET